MRLYHLTKSILIQTISLIGLVMALWGCTQAQATQEQISISIRADHQEVQLEIAAGSTVQQALELGGVTLGDLDNVEPGLGVVLSNGSQVVVTRITEEEYDEQQFIPFTHEELKNEALPEGERRLSQPGANGVEEITYKRIYADGVEVANSIIKTVVTQPPVPEVVMVGSRAISAALAIPGKLAYLAAGNAWIMENNTGDRRLVVSTGDLDGRIFSLSPNGKYLLFTRFSTTAGEINSLWAAWLENDPPSLIDLGGMNVVHFAEFDPSSTIVAYSTSAWRKSSPGWQANNDLFEVKIIPDGTVGSTQQDLPPSSGGLYGWWGMDFAWSPDGSQLAFSRPDAIGIFDRQARAHTTLLEFTPYQTRGDWAWVPGVSWSPDGNVIYTVNRAISETQGSGTPGSFDLIAILLHGGSPVTLAKDVGMFSYPDASPAGIGSTLVDPSTGASYAQADFSVAYLQALQPEQSETGAYQLFTIDRNGSNRNALFPPAGESGLSPQRVAWSPASLGEGGNLAVGLVYNGNIWIIDGVTGAARQVTADGLVTRLDWR